MATTICGSTTSSRACWALDIEARARRPILQNTFNERAPTLSPDGRWLAAEPRWARNGRELFFRQGNTMMAVASQSEPPFPPPTSLFTAGTEIRVVLNWAEQLKRLAPK